MKTEWHYTRRAHRLLWLYCVTSYSPDDAHTTRRTADRSIVQHCLPVSPTYYSCRPSGRHMDLASAGGA